MASLEDIGSQEARDELALLAHKLSINPKTRKEFLKLAKQENPEMPVPELILEDNIDQLRKDSDDKIAKLEAKLSEKEMREELGRRRSKLGRSDEEIEQIEKLMLEKGIQSHETAADYFDWMKQAATPTPVAYDRNVLDTDTKSRLLPFMKNPVHAAREEAGRAFADLRKNPKLAG